MVETATRGGDWLADRNLTASNKLLWAWLHFEQPSVRALSRESGFGRCTVCAGLERLEVGGWTQRLESGPDRVRGYRLLPVCGQFAELPVQLLKARNVRPRAKVVYCCLQLAAGFYSMRGRLSLTQLHRIAGISQKTVRRALNDLQAGGWASVKQENRPAPVAFGLHNPVFHRQVHAVERCQFRVRRSDYLGQTLAREGIKTLVKTDNFIEDARLHWCTNPETGEWLELDMWFPDERVGIEFDGPQHYSPTARYSDEDAWRRQQARDLVKEALAAREAVSLVRVRPQDLELAKLMQLLDGLLPLRDPKDCQPLVEYLNYEMDTYRAAMQHLF